MSVKEEIKTHLNRWGKIFIVLAVIFASFSMISVPQCLVSVIFKDSSKLSLKGSSNINTFDCECKKHFPPRVFSVELSDSNKIIRFFNAVLLIPVSSLNCKNSSMNKSLFRAMKGDRYPNVKLEVHEAILSSDEYENNKPLKISALSTITVAGVSKKMKILLNAFKTDSDTYHLVGYQDIEMTDFNIIPPTVLLGLVKVNNQIRINFDLEVMSSSVEIISGTTH